MKKVTILVILSLLSWSNTDAQFISGISKTGTTAASFLEMVMPSKCTIKIFSVSGKLVITIDHETTVDNGSEFWNLRTKDGLDAAYGYYFYVVEASDIGVSKGKFALIK